MRFDDAFANSKYLADGKDFPSRWAAKAAGFREGMGENARLGLQYGAQDREWFDLFLPAQEPKGMVVCVHGGEWLAFGPRDFSHLAAGSVQSGWACAMPSYRLAPAVRISEITEEIGAAVAAAAATVQGPIVLTGHSAGGHLVARMAVARQILPPEVAARVVNVVPVSPLADLRPLLETSMNAVLRMDLAEARSESPALLSRRAGLPVHVWVGGAERPAYLDQSRRLGNAWSCPVTVDPGRHHFNVIEGFEDAESPLMRALLGD